MVLSVLDNNTRQQIVSRIQNLSPGSAKQWGTMNVYQMVKHCVLCEQLYLGKLHIKRSLLGRIFGQLALKKMTKDDTPLKANEPTSPHFKVAEVSGDLEAEKQQWIDLINEYANFPSKPFTHWFFGKMSKEQVGVFAYKHNDHHLRQFGC